MPEYVRVMLFLAGVIVFLAGCNDAPDPVVPPKPYFAIDLQTGFAAETVQVQLDKRVIYLEVTETDTTRGLAKRLTPSTVEGYHLVRVSIPSHSITKDTLVWVSDCVSLAVNHTGNHLAFAVYHCKLSYPN